MFLEFLLIFALISFVCFCYAFNLIFWLSIFSNYYLTNFFSSILLKRNGGVDFSEFVMFVIDEMVEQSYVRVCQRLKLLGKKSAQRPRPASISKVTCCKRVGELKCLLLGAEGGLHFHLEDEDSLSWLTCLAKVRCCVVLDCVMLYCVMLYCVVLCCIVLYYVGLGWVVLYCIVLYSIV